MRGGIVISRIGGEDGVGLETEKWIKALSDMNHELFLLSGEYERNILDKKHQDYLLELCLLSGKNWWEQKKAFLTPDNNPDEVLNYIKNKSDKISNEIINFVNKKNLDFIISENASALPFNLSMTVGIKKAVEKTGIKTITHDHDFYWERGTRYKSYHKEINQLVEDTIPLNLSNITNIAINTIARKKLQDDYNISNAMVIPNVMDFNNKDNHKKRERNFLKNFNLEEGVILLQPTRIIKRKGIETAIELIHKLNDKKIKLFITGSDKDNGNKDYYNELSFLANSLGLEKQVIFAKKPIQNSSLLRLYSHINSCTYFSEYEGFGNVFVEAAYKKTPIFVNNYPVFKADIKEKEFDVVLIEDNVLTNNALGDIKEIIYNDKRKKEIGDHNFEMGKKYFSYEVLKEKLQEVLN